MASGWKDAHPLKQTGLERRVYVGPNRLCGPARHRGEKRAAGPVAPARDASWAPSRAVAFPLHIAEKKIIKSMDRRDHKVHLHRASVHVCYTSTLGFGGAGSGRKRARSSAADAKKMKKRMTIRSDPRNKNSHCFVLRVSCFHQVPRKMVLCAGHGCFASGFHQSSNQKASFRNGSGKKI